MHWAKSPERQTKREGKDYTGSKLKGDWLQQHNEG